MSYGYVLQLTLTQLRLNGTVEVMLPDSTVAVLPLSRLTRLYDGLEQLEDMWGDDVSQSEDSYRDVLCMPVIQRHDERGNVELTPTKEMASIRLCRRKVWRETRERPAAELLSAACRRNSASKRKLTRVEIPESEREGMRHRRKAKEGGRTRCDLAVQPLGPVR